jgi:hypothetical protein
MLHEMSFEKAMKCYCEGKMVLSFRIGPTGFETKFLEDMLAQYRFLVDEEEGGESGKAAGPEESERDSNECSKTEKSAPANMTPESRTEEEAPEPEREEEKTQQGEPDPAVKPEKERISVPKTKKGYATKPDQKHIKDLYTSGMSMEEISEELGIQLAAVSKVVSVLGLGDARHKGTYIPNTGSKAVSNGSVVR